MRRLPSEWARWGLLATTLILGATLIATTWVSHRGIVAASAQLARSQADSLFNAIRRDLAAQPAPPLATDLATLIGRYRGSGLLHLAIVDRRGMVLVSAGESSASRAEPYPTPRPGGGRRWTVEGDIYRLVAPLEPEPGPPRPPASGPAARPDPPRGRPPRRGDHDRDHDHEATRPPPRRQPGRRPPRERPSDDGGRPRRGAPEHLLAIATEASTARRLTQQTANALGIGTASTLFLMIAALLFWHQARERERAQRQLEEQERLSALGEMSAVLAHEIRNPLASLKGHAQLLGEQIAGDHPAGRKVQRIVGEAARLEKLTTDLLSFARAGSLDRRPVDPVAVVDDCRQEVGDGRIRVDSTAAPARWPLDRLRIHQVLANLLRNAVQASPADAAVDVKVDVAGSGRGAALRLVVRDRGPGLPAGHEDEIFDPFFTTRTHGTGLGLAVARRIVELHGGTLTGRNHPVGGAELEMRIPNRES